MFLGQILSRLAVRRVYLCWMRATTLTIDTGGQSSGMANFRPTSVGAICSSLLLALVAGALILC